jgi:apolipoprotein N-acyltransferase
MSKMIFFYPILGGALLFIAGSYPGFWFLAFFSFWPFLYFLYRATDIKRACFGGFVFGLIFWLLAARWFFDAYPLDWAGISGSVLGWSVILLAWLLFASVLAFFTAGFGALFFWLKQEAFGDALLVPALWIIFEYLRAWGFALLSWSPQSLLGAHFTFGAVGYSLAGNGNVLRLASLGGVYFLSFAAVFIAALSYWFIFLYRGKKRKEKTAIFLLFLFLLAFLSYFPFAKIVPLKAESAPSIRVAVLQTQLPSLLRISEREKERRRNIYKELLNDIQEQKEAPALVVFPEDTRFVRDLIEQGRAAIFFENIFGEQEVMVIDSGRVVAPGSKPKSRLFYYNSQQGLVQTYDKVFLMAGGEYWPSFVSALFEILGQKRLVDQFNKSREYGRGEELAAGEFRGYRLGVLFCSEIISPGLHRAAVEKGANLLLNTASQSVFHGSDLLYRQILNVAKVRAAENNRYFVQAGNFIPSSIIDNKGAVIFSTGARGDSVLYGRARLIEKKTFYGRWGEWIVGLSFLLTLLCFRYKMRGKSLKKGGE